MSVSIVVTRNVSPRIRGFLASSMLEVGPGVYVSPKVSPSVRERIFGVLSEWFPEEQDASIIFIWEDKSIPWGINVDVLGLPPLDLVEIDGILLTRKYSKDEYQER